VSRLVYGLHPVEELLRKRPAEVKALLHAERPPRALLAEAEARGIALTRSTSEELEALCQSSSHQGVVALVGEYRYHALDELLGGDERPLLVAADSLMDPQNLGSIIRTTLVIGGTGLILPKDRSVSITPTVVRVSSGATEHLRCARVTNLVRALGELKQAGLWVAGTVESGGMHPADADLDVPLVVVIGSEQKGIRPLVRRHCDLLLTIPSPSSLASLNVAAATAAVLYEVARQRRRGVTSSSV